MAVPAGPTYVNPVTGALGYDALAVGGSETVAGTLDVTGTLTALGYLAVGANAGITGVLDVSGSNSGIWGPRDNGLIASAFDPGDSSGTLTLTGGTIYLTKLQIARAATPTKLYWYVATQAVTATASQCWVSVLNSSGTILAAPVDVATASETIGLKTTTVAPGALAAGAFVWAAIVLAGSTVGTVAVQNGSAKPTMTNVGLTAATLRYATNGTSQTTITNRTPGSNTAGPAVWFALGT